MGQISEIDEIMISNLPGYPDSGCESLQDQKGYLWYFINEKKHSF